MNDVKRKQFPFLDALDERILQTENVCVFVCPTNQKAAFRNERRTADFGCKTE